MAAEQETTHGTIEVPASHDAPSGEHGGGNPVNVTPSMVGLTWITFLLMAFVLYKVAWKPILTALEAREEDLRRAIDNAQKTRDELAKIDATRQKMVSEADAKAREIVDAARQAAVDAAAVIEHKARDEAQILLENAQREIRTEQQRAMAALRKESADLAIQLARKVIGENLDEARGRAITDKLIKDL